jgi:hypothetical protein
MLMIFTTVVAAIIVALVFFGVGRFILTNAMGFVDGFFEGLFGKDSKMNTYWPFVAFGVISVVSMIATRLVD